MRREELEEWAVNVEAALKQAQALARLLALQLEEIEAQIRAMGRNEVEK